MTNNLEELTEKQILLEILKWQKFQAIGPLKDTLLTLLDSDEKKLVYELTDGENSSRDIAKLVSVSQGTVSNHWQSWFDMNVIEKDGRSYRKLISLKELGMDVPSLPTSKRKKGGD